MKGEAVRGLGNIHSTSELGKRANHPNPSSGSEKTCLSRCWDVAKNTELTEVRAWPMAGCWHVHIWIPNQPSNLNYDRQCLGGRPRKQALPLFPSLPPGSDLTSFIRILSVKIFTSPWGDEHASYFLKKCEKTSGIKAEVPNSTTLDVAVSLTA